MGMESVQKQETARMGHTAREHSDGTAHRGDGIQGRQRTGEMACRRNGMQEMAFTAKSAPEVADDHNLHNNNQWAMRAMRAMRATRAMRH